MAGEEEDDVVVSSMNLIISLLTSTSVESVVTLNMHKASAAQLRNISARSVRNMDTSPAYAEVTVSRMQAATSTK